MENLEPRESQFQWVLDMMVNWDLMIALLKKNIQHLKHTFSEHHTYLFRMFKSILTSFSVFISPRKIGELAVKDYPVSPIIIFQWKNITLNKRRLIWMLPKNSGTLTSSILIGFSIIFTIHFRVPLFLETPILEMHPFSRKKTRFWEDPGTVHGMSAGHFPQWKNLRVNMVPSKSFER